MASYRKLEGYSNGKPNIGWWRAEIAKGLDFRKKKAFEHKWITWNNAYRGIWPDRVIPVNLFFKMIRTTVPRIYFRNPSISVQATKPGLEQQIFAQMIERIDNKLIRTMGVKNQMKKMIQLTWTYGTSAGKLGFGAQFTPTPGTFDTSAPERVVARGLTRKVEWNSLVQANMPWFMSVSPRNLVVPNDLEAFEETPWVAMKIKRSKDDVKADPRMQNTSSIVGSGSTDANRTGWLARAADSNKNEIEMYEIRDMRTGLVMIMPAYDGNEFFLTEDDEFQLNGRPNIYPLQFNPDPECFWAVPDAQILEPQQLELNEVRTLQMRHRRIAIVKLMYKGGALDDGELEKLLNGDPGIGVKINKDADMTDVESFQVGTIPDALFSADQTIQQDVRDMMGFSRNQSGEFAGQKSHSAPTAFEASVVNAASEIRVDERKDACADILVNVFEDTNPLIFDQWTDEQVVQVMGPESIPYWVAFKPAMLKGARYELQIDPDSTTPETKDVRQQKAERMYDRLKLNPLVDPVMLTKYLLRESHGVQFDNMMAAIQSNAAAGVPGSSPDNPMGPADLMQMMQKGGGKPPAAG